MKTSDNCFSCSETNQRENNEDYCIVFPIAFALNELPVQVLIVADGMGGHEHGEDVSRQAVLKVKDFFDKAVLDYALQPTGLTLERLAEIVYQALESTNRLVQRMVEANGWKRAGSTIVIAAIWRDQVIAANLGDSPLFHYRARHHTTVRVTQDHSVTGILVQAHLITEQMARYHERRGQLEYFLGTTALPTPRPLYRFNLEPGDLLLLCSDGISGSLELEQITTILDRPEINLADKARQLLDMSRSTGEMDNQTLILWRYRGDRGSGVSALPALPASTVIQAPLHPPIPDSLVPAPSENPSGSIPPIPGSIPPPTPANASISQSQLVLHATAIDPSRDRSAASARHRPPTQTSARSLLPKRLSPLFHPKGQGQQRLRIRRWLVPFGLGVALSILFSTVNSPPPLPFVRRPPAPTPPPASLPPRSDTTFSDGLTEITGADSHLQIDRFTQDGSTLYTLDNQTGASQAWQVQSVSGQLPACQSALKVPREVQDRSFHKIIEVSLDRQKVPRFLVTRSDRGCLRKWVNTHESSLSPIEPSSSPQVQPPLPQKDWLEKLQTFFQNLLSRLSSKE